MCTQSGYSRIERVARHPCTTEGATNGDTRKRNSCTFQAVCRIKLINLYYRRRQHLNGDGISTVTALSVSNHQIVCGGRQRTSLWIGGSWRRQARSRTPHVLIVAISANG